MEDEKSGLTFNFPWTPGTRLFFLKRTETGRVICLIDEEWTYETDGKIGWVRFNNERYDIISPMETNGGKMGVFDNYSDALMRQKAFNVKI